MSTHNICFQLRPTPYMYVINWDTLNEYLQHMYSIETHTICNQMRTFQRSTHNICVQLRQFKWVPTTYVFNGDIINEYPQHMYSIKTLQIVPTTYVFMVKNSYLETTFIKGFVLDSCLHIDEWIVLLHVVLHIIIQCSCLRFFLHYDHVRCKNQISTIKPLLCKFVWESCAN